MKVNMTAFLSLATAAITTFPTSHFISAFSGTISKRSPFLAKGARISSLFSTTAEPPVDNDTTQNNDSSASIYDVQAEALSKVQSPFLQTMRDRGFLHQCTNLEELDKSMVETSKEGKALSAYLGFDATADSLHVGSLLQIMILRHYQKSGHQPIVLIGGGTSKVGDPTGKDESRKMLTEEVILQNTAGISKVFQKFLTFKDDKSDSNIPSEAIMVNNDDWLSTLKYLEFLRDYGTHFTINRMLSFESVKQRLAREAPFSFLEFNYMILQAYDFLELNRRYGAKLQLGGSDQWGNIVAGTELGRRCDGVQLFGLTAPLITTSDGKKMGKTANGAVWLNADRLSEYDYWQFWRNTADADVLRFMKLFTELPLEDINEMSKLEGADINKAKIVLADEATALLHGKDCLPKIHETVENMFKSGSGGGTESLPRIFVTKDDLGTDSSKLLDLFLNLKLGSSKKDIRRLIEGGGAKLGETVISDQNASLTIDDFNGSNEVVLRAGKKRAGVVELK
jgi:tyrosyl-tRNA synthetase